jgi:hypothetical protein
MAVDTRGDEVSLATIPLRQNFMRWCAAKDSGVNQAGKSHSRDVSACAIDAVKIPDGLGSLGIVILKEPSTVVAIKDSRETPWCVFKRLDIRDVDHQQIPWFGALNLEWTGQVMNLAQVYRAYILGAIVVANLTAGPVDAFNLDSLSRLDRPNCRDYRRVSMP